MKEYRKPEIELVKFEAEVIAVDGMPDNEDDYVSNPFVGGLT